MPPGGGGGSEHARTGEEQSHPPAVRRRDESCPAPPFPAVDSQKKKKKRRKQRQPAPAAAAESVSEGPLVEILARLPYRSLCRFQCVTKQWRELCSDPQIVKRASQTLSGFFHNPQIGSLRFSNLSGGRPLVDASLPFLCGRYQRIKLEQCSTSLLLCKCWKLESEKDEFDFVVCNPMTEQWTVLPPIEWPDDEDGEYTECFELRYPFLVFDPAMPSRFVVFAPLLESVDVVAVYSWETGQWAPSSGWEYRQYPAVTAECAVLNGMIHFFHLFPDEPFIIVLDIEGWVLRKIAAPDGMLGATPGYGSVGCSRGLLHAWYMDPHDYQLSVWVLKSYGSGEWILKHTVDVAELFEETQSDQEEDSDQEDGSCKYEMFAIHPDYNVIFLTDRKAVNLSYDMDSGQVRPISTTSGDLLGGLPFIPCFADLALG